MKLIYNIIGAGLLALMLLVSQVGAQDAPQIDYATWDTFATQAEAALGNRDSSLEQLNSVRQNADQWRSEFRDAQGANAPAIQTVKDQITALGPAPAEGDTEAEDIAGRRVALNKQLADLQAPGITAAEALSRANSIITRVDEIQRDREAQEIARMTPSPLLPSSWVAAAKEIQAVFKGMGDELRKEASYDTLRENLLEVLAYLLGAIGLLTYGRRLVDQLPSHVGSRSTGDAKAIIAFLTSLGQILIPMVGVYLLVTGLDKAGFFGPWTRPLMIAVPLGALSFWSGRWLVRVLFSARPVAYATLTVPAHARAYARIYGTGLSVALAWHIVLSFAMLPLAGYVRDSNAPPQIPYEFSLAGAGVVHFVLLVIGGFFLFQMSNILRRMKRFSGTETPPYRARVLTILGKILRIAIVVSLLMAALGYINFANAVFWALVESAALIGLLIVLQDFVADVYSLLRRGRDGARESLAALALGFLMVLVSLPLFALIWGTTPAQLIEWRHRFLAGMSVGGVNISPGGILTFLIVFMLGYTATRWIQRAMRVSVLPRTRLDSGAQNAMVSGLGYIGVFLAAVFAITTAGIDLSSLAIVAGALSVGIGFGLQTIVQNFVSGIILLIERPISVGDWVEAGGQQGIVQDISVRSTRIRTFDQTDVIVPNSDLVSQTVTNWTRGNSRGRIIVKVGVAYGSDTRKVERILREIAEDQPTVLIDPPPAVLLMNFGADSLDFEVRCVLADIAGGVAVASEMRHQIAQRFSAEGIEIPFAQRDLWLRNPETLFARPAARTAAHSAPKHGEAEPPEAAGSHRPADIRSVGQLPNDGDGIADNDGGDGDNF